MHQEAKQKLHLILDQKEIYWLQRSKKLWLQSGDKNTKYFHASYNIRRRTNQIQKLQNKNGEWLSWESGLEDHVTGYYTELFSTAYSSTAEVINCVSQKISYAQNLELQTEITEEEVRPALFQMHPDKAPGPNGMTPAFHQKHWSVVGKDVIKLVRNFFHNRVLPQGLNKTHMVLIPKKKNPVKIGDLRPIALCNVLMKIITKVIANRMKDILEGVVSGAHSAFIPGRLISDNIMISYEVMHKKKEIREGGLHGGKT